MTDRIEFKCDKCTAEVSFPAFVISVSAFGVFFLFGKNDGYVGYTCPHCMKNVFQNKENNEIQSIRTNLINVANPNEPSVLRYNSFPYFSITPGGKPLGYRFFHNVDNSKIILGPDNYRHILERISKKSEEYYCTYFENDYIIGPQVQISWYSRNSLNTLFEIVSDKRHVLPCYVYYDEAFDNYNNLVWKYYLQERTLRTVNLQYPDGNLHNAISISSNQETKNKQIVQTIIAGNTNSPVTVPKSIVRYVKENINIISNIRLGEYLHKTRTDSDDFFELSKEIITYLPVYSNPKTTDRVNRFLKDFIRHPTHSLPSISLLGCNFANSLVKIFEKDYKNHLKGISGISFALVTTPMLEIIGNLFEKANRLLEQYDFVDFDEDFTDVPPLDSQSLEEEVSLLDAKYPQLERIITQSSKMMELKYKLCRISQFDVDILILGETGTGKELIARAIHESSERQGNFVPINCAGIPKDLFESELFGHKKGAFTGAVSDKKGAFETANFGTLFLDELGEMPIDLQAKILRAVEYREVAPVGSSQVQKVNVKLVFATNRDLQKEVDKGNFREDLFFRIFTPCLPIPPLRDRKEDIPLLTQFFCLMFSHKFKKNIREIDDEIFESFQAYHWKGNVRELMKLMEMMVLNARGPKLTTRDLPEFHAISKEFESVQELNVEVPPARAATDEDIKYWYTKLDGNKSQVANRLGISYRTVLRRCQKMGL